MTLNCFKCDAEVVFDSEHIGRNGKKIPLDPDTYSPHKCPMSDYNKEKDDHGNELVQDTTKAESPKQMYERYIDHTQGQKLKLRIFSNPTPGGLELEYNNFAAVANIKFSQYQIAGSLYTIAVWYEEAGK